MVTNTSEILQICEILIQELQKSGFEEDHDLSGDASHPIVFKKLIGYGFPHDLIDDKYLVVKVLDPLPESRSIPVWLDKMYANELENSMGRSFIYYEIREEEEVSKIIDILKLAEGK